MPNSRIVSLLPCQERIEVRTQFLVKGAQVPGSHRILLTLTLS